MNWVTKASKRVMDDREKILGQCSAYVDLANSDQPGLKFDDETLFVSAAFSLVNAPWVVDLDLPLYEFPSISIPSSDTPDDLKFAISGQIFQCKVADHSLL